MAFHVETNERHETICEPAMLDYSCPLQAAREHPGQSNVRIQTSVRVHARIKVCDVCLSNVNLSEQRWVNLSERHRHCTFRVETMPHVSGAKRPPKSLLFPAERMCATPEAGRRLKRSVPHSILVGLVLEAVRDVGDTPQ